MDMGFTSSNTFGRARNGIAPDIFCPTRASDIHAHEHKTIAVIDSNFVIASKRLIEKICWYKASTNKEEVEKVERIDKRID